MNSVSCRLNIHITAIDRIAPVCPQGAVERGVKLSSSTSTRRNRPPTVRRGARRRNTMMVENRMPILVLWSSSAVTSTSM